MTRAGVSSLFGFGLPSGHCCQFGMNRFMRGVFDIYGWEWLSGRGSRGIITVFTIENEENDGIVLNRRTRFYPPYEVPSPQPLSI